jgi:membrane fusion protein (multidrug efflux system)
MKKIRVTILIVLPLLILVSCGPKKKDVAVAEKPIAVTIASATARDIAITQTYTGTLEGFKQAKIYSSIPEAIVELPVSEGSLVEAGQPIILLDKEGPTSRYKQSEATYLDAKDNYEKMGELFKQGAISQQTYNSLKTNFEIARANFAAAKQQVELTSPISGILTDLSVNVGQYAPLGVPLATVAQTNKMRLTIYIDGRSAKFIKKGQDAIITVNNYGNDSLSIVGTVTEVAKSADPDTRQFRVELQIDNRKGILSPGMYARATITTARLNNVLTVPKESVFLIEGISKVYILSDDNHAKEQTISIGESTPEYYQVKSGLTPGETVIVLGRSQVEDGSPVKVMDNLEIAEPSTESKES